MKEEEARNRYNHTYCLALKKKLNKVTAEFKSVNDKYANVTRKIEQADNLQKDYQNRLDMAKDYYI